MECWSIYIDKSIHNLNTDKRIAYAKVFMQYIYHEPYLLICLLIVTIFIQHSTNFLWSLDLNAPVSVFTRPIQLPK